MSMYKQLWLSVILGTALALAGSLLASTLSARAYLAQQLSLKNADNATMLALVLSRQESDATSIELAASALFDNGHYETVRVTDPDGRVIVERSATSAQTRDEREAKDAPAWFMRLLPIAAQPGQAQITNGWMQIGSVHIVSHSRFAYRALWESVLRMTLALAIAGLLAGYLGGLVLRRLRGPLEAVIGQARAISERRFITIAEPRVPELKTLAAAMNATVTRLKAMFEEEALRLEALRREANCDALTGLANRSHFMARLREAAQGEESMGGALFIVRLAQLAEINQNLGREATDELLRRFGQALAEAGGSAGSAAESLAARLNGADFALLITGAAAAEAQAVGHRLLQRLAGEAAAFLPGRSSTRIGGAPFARGSEPGAILARVDAALAAVEAEGRDALRFITPHEAENAPRNAEEWSDLICGALDRGWVRLVAFPVRNAEGRLLHHECPLRLRFEEEGDWQPAGRFLPVAERLRLTARLDLAAVALGLNRLDAHPELSGLAVNLSASSLQSPEFSADLRALLTHRAASRLWLEVSEAGALAHLEAFRALCLNVKALGGRIGVEHFGHQFSAIGRFHGLGLDYLKVDASFIRDIDRHPGNQAFLKGLCGIAHGIGLIVIAEGVQSAAEMATLPGLGFNGLTGPAVVDGEGAIQRET